MAFATSADLVNRYDARTLGDLVNDDGSRATEAELEVSAKVTAALESASGMVLSACVKGGRYTAAELSALTGDSLAHLVDLTCRIAFWLLWKRRPWSDKYENQRNEAKKHNDEALEMLRSGQEVFAVDRAIEAGSPEVIGVDLTEVLSWNLVVDRARGSFYPPRRFVD